MTQRLSTARGRSISNTELTKPLSCTPQQIRGNTPGRPISSSRPEKYSIKYTQTLPTPEHLSRYCLEAATEVGKRDTERQKGEGVGEHSEELRCRNTCRVKASAGHRDLPQSPQHPRTPQPFQKQSRRVGMEALQSHFCSAKDEGSMLRIRTSVSAVSFGGLLNREKEPQEKQKVQTAAQKQVTRADLRPHHAGIALFLPPIRDRRCLWYGRQQRG